MRRPLIIERRNIVPTLKFMGIVKGDRDRLEGIVGDQRIVVVRDKSIHSPVEYRLYAEQLPRKPKPHHGPYFQ
jgi:hypothetical protein